MMCPPGPSFVIISFNHPLLVHAIKDQTIFQCNTINLVQVSKTTREDPCKTLKKKLTDCPLFPKTKDGDAAPWILVVGGVGEGVGEGPGVSCPSPMARLLLSSTRCSSASPTFRLILFRDPALLWPGRFMVSWERIGQPIRIGEEGKPIMSMKIIESRVNQAGFDFSKPP